MRLRERQRRAQQQYAREEQVARKRGGGVAAKPAAPRKLSSLPLHSTEGSMDYYNSPRHGFDVHTAYRLHGRIKLNILPVSVIDGDEKLSTRSDR